jgi:chemotaxis protein MotB
MISKKVTNHAHNNWLITYGDLITLLVTFFIMATAHHASGSGQVKKWIGHRYDESIQQVNELIVKNRMTDVLAYKETNGIKIVFKDANLFRAGRADETDALSKTINNIADIVKNLSLLKLRSEPQHNNVLGELEKNNLFWHAEIRIEGHTDNIPIKVTKNSAYQDNWQLSAARAETVMKLLQEKTQLGSEFFAVSGFGEFQPIASNETDEGRAQNRRIEIFLGGSMVGKRFIDSMQN